MAGFCYSLVMKNFLFLLIGLGIFVGSFVLFLRQPTERPVYVKIGNSLIEVAVASTPEERARGLSGRESLETGTGLLFIFDKPDIYAFWMKEMNFPIDIVWISSENRIIGIEHSVSPDSYPQTFSSSGPVKYVLEIPAGYSRAYNIDSGMQVFFDARISGYPHSPRD
jgi:uncharacterized protein